MKEEKSKLKDSASFALKTPFVLEEIPHQPVGTTKFQVKIYRPNKLEGIIIHRVKR